MEIGSVKEGDLLWQPSEEVKNAANVSQYMNWLKDEKGRHFKTYEDLWEWSVTNIEDFWESIWHFYGTKASSPYSTVITERSMPGAVWFKDAKLNYTEQVFRNLRSETPALKFQSEISPYVEISWEELHQQVVAIALSLRKMGVGPGDRVVAYLPNIPQTLVAFLACASIGATWSSCSPDFGARSVLDRFQQIEPKVLFGVDGYQYGGRKFDCRPIMMKLQQAMPTLKHTVIVPYLNPEGTPEGFRPGHIWDDLLNETGDLEYEQVDFNHPLWVVYSSGTTGLPKPLVHGHGGIILELQKFLGLHVNIKKGETLFWFSTTGWVMWNILQAGLMLGATAVLYDGSPGYPDMDVLWELAEKAKMNVFGTSAAFITACMNEGMEPGKKHDLSALKAVGSTGSPLSPAGFKWVYDSIKDDILLGSVSGGTDPCTAFLGCCPLLPVRAGELQCRCLGVRAEALDDSGRELVNEVGELVISEPMPSMPLYLWNDPDNKRYIESYFEKYPGKWRHGDWVKITPSGSCVVLGRSDSTLKRMGVRMGSSEIYGVVDEIPEVVESLIVGFEGPDGRYLMPLFVALQPGLELDDSLKKKIAAKIRSSLSPRHVPDEIYVVPEIPKTLNMKKLEVPVKKILSGLPPETSVNLDSMSNPESLDFFIDMAKEMYGSKQV
ncbi:MAG: acetoacetate--CoA ligase [Desulfomonilaceae bacterium]|nr:acetoacetate--CoA ligase [Desulfomonilaceae bacterium]